MKIFGAGSYPYSETDAKNSGYTGPAYCDITAIPGLGLGNGSYAVYLYPKTPTVSTMSQFETTDVSTPGARTSLRGLGAGAGFYRYGHLPSIYFEAGPYFVVFESNNDGGSSNSEYPSETQLVALAHAVRSKLG